MGFFDFIVWICSIEISSNEPKTGLTIQTRI